VLATLATSRTDALQAGGEPTAAALAGGYHLAFIIGGRGYGDGEGACSSARY
jgi:hypothetical protein